MPIRPLDQGAHWASQRALATRNTTCLSQRVVECCNWQHTRAPFGKANGIDLLSRTCINTQPTLDTLVHVTVNARRRVVVQLMLGMLRRPSLRFGNNGKPHFFYLFLLDETLELAIPRGFASDALVGMTAKQELEISVPTGQAARITVQDLFLRYPHLAGMTGTAASSAGELRKIYRTPVIRVPTNKPPKREQLADRVFGTMEAKFEAIVREIKEVHETGRPVLVGTRSIDKSVVLSRMLEEIGIEHQVLNANNVEQEAEIVAAAGGHGKVTVATNMAGRGTDVKLDMQIESAGGMHVICTELHDAARIDRQLIGRCGRQGDRGSYRQYLSLDDDILKGGLGPKKAERMKEQGTQVDGSVDRYAGLFRRAQLKVEKTHFRDRMILLHHEKERKKMQREIGQDPYLDTPD